MRCTLPPGARALSEAGGPRGPKPSGSRRPLRRRAGGGVVGGKKYLSLELDATTTAGDKALTVGLGTGSDVGGGCGSCQHLSSFLFNDKVFIFPLNIFF